MTSGGSTERASGVGAGALVGMVLGLATAVADSGSVASLSVEHQTAFALLHAGSWGAVGVACDLALGLLRRLGGRRLWPGWGALGAFAALALVGGEHLLGLAAAAALLALTGGLVGRVLPFVERAAPWGLAAFALAVAAALRIAGTPAAPHGGPGAAGWLALPAAAGLLALPWRAWPVRAVSAAAFGALAVQAAVRIHGPDLAPRREGGPSVLLVTIDTLRADALGCYGDERAHTPNLDRLASEGVLFEHAQSPVPMTDPSHTSILSGLYPGNHGVLTNMPWPIAPGVRTLPEVMAAEGWRTAAFVSGFTLKRSASRLHERFQLFDDNFAGHPELPDPWLESPLPELARVVGRMLGLRLHGLRSGGERPADRTVPAALDWLERDAGPFFLWVHLFDPHLPYEPPAEHLAKVGADGSAGRLGELWYRLDAERRMEVVRSERDQEALHALYRAEVSHADEEVGRLLDRLRERGRLDDTLVVVTSDHGESLGEHDYWYDHGHFLYDTCLRVPLVVRPLGGASSPRRVSRQVRLIDVAPTVLDVLGLGGERLNTGPIDGRSLAPLFEDGELGEEPAFAVAYDLRAGQWRFLLSARTERWKYVRTAPGWDDLLYLPEREELFDLEADPGETRDVSAAEPVVLRQLRALAERHFEAWRSPDPTRAGSVSARAKEQLEGLGYF